MKQLMICSMVLLLAVAPAYAQKSKRSAKQSTQPTTGPQDYRSKNFLVHTDLPKEEAKELLKKLEHMLSIISKYWARPNKKLIEVYVVKNLKTWPNGSIDPRALGHIVQGGGLTITRTRISQSIVTGTQVDGNAVAYAVAERGTPLHEAVHAYCGINFGTTGPVWYSEGMAEMGAYWNENDSSVNIDPVVMKYLQKSEPKAFREIVRTDQVTGDSWQNYAWRWALCHMLAYNPNYSKRFRPLGLDLLTNNRSSFRSVYGSMAEELEFEYRQFLGNIEQGYRVDLCSWNWKTKFRAPNARSRVIAKVLAKKGWQPSRLLVKAGTSYKYKATGQWKLDKKGEAVDADGETDTGKGLLMGTIFNDYKLSEPIELGKEGTFAAENDGKLYVRCLDDWGKIGDNTGSVKVILSKE